MKIMQNLSSKSSYTEACCINAENDILSLGRPKFCRMHGIVKLSFPQARCDSHLSLGIADGGQYVCTLGGRVGEVVVETQVQHVHILGRQLLDNLPAWRASVSFPLPFIRSTYTKHKGEMEGGRVEGKEHKRARSLAICHCTCLNAVIWFNAKCA
jgi:hypothetical protein